MLEVWSYLFLRGEGDDFAFVGVCGEDFAVWTWLAMWLGERRGRGKGEVQPKIIATTKSDPQRFPQNVMNQWSSIFHQGSWRCRAATVVNWYLSLVLLSLEVGGKERDVP